MKYQDLLTEARETYESSRRHLFQSHKHNTPVDPSRLHILSELADDLHAARLDQETTRDEYNAIKEAKRDIAQVYFQIAERIAQTGVGILSYYSTELDEALTK